MATLNKGIALVSVADVLFFDPVTGNYMGEGFALTDSTITQEMQSIEQRGGYLNALLFNIKHSKTVSVNITSATFKMEYLAFQTGTPIVSNLAGIYKFDECVSFTNGVGQTAQTPLGNVYVRMPSGAVSEITPTGKQIDIGQGQFNGQLQVMYQYNKQVSQITIDTKSQPLTLKAVLKIHTLTQDGEEGEIQITVPRLKFDGAINLALTSDGVSTFGLNGMAQEVATDCGESYYADAKYVAAESEEIAVSAIVASPNTYALDMSGVTTATATVIGVRNRPYSNIIFDNSALTFESSADDTVSVTAEGLMTALKAGDATITVTYQGMQDTISITVS